MPEKLTQEAIAKAPDETLQDILDADAILDALAKLPLLAYGQCRKGEAKRLGVPVSYLDIEVSKRRPQHVLQEAQGMPVAFEAPEPWPDEVHGADLLKDLVQVFAKHLVLPPGAATVLALWTLHAYTYDAGYITPRLGIISPQKRCGKTRVLEALSLLTPRALLSSNATVAAIFRAIELWKPTLLIDEADTILPGNEELRGILNSGHTKRTAYVLRTVGEDHEPRRFSTWAPLAIAMIGALPGTLADRSIVLPMRRKKREEQVDPLPLDDTAQPFADLRRQCARWATDHFDTLRECMPAVPDGLHDRAADNWRPLCAIAEVAGGDWPDRTKSAIRALAGMAPADDETGVLLLKAMQQIFQEQHTDRIYSEVLEEILRAMEGSPWPEYGRQRKPITKHQIARLLKPFEIHPKTIRINTETGKGYLLDDCQDAFTRYIPPTALALQTVTPSHASIGAGLRENHLVTLSEDVTDGKWQNPASNLTCDDVTARQGELWRHEV